MTLEEGFSDQQEDLRVSFRRLLVEKAPSETVRRVIQQDPGYDHALWMQFAELGVAGLGIPEQFGGSGGGVPELIVIAEEMGRVLVPSPWFSTNVLAAHAVLAAEDSAAASELLPDLCNGRITATVALAEQGGEWRHPSSSMRATPAGDRYRISGVTTYVSDGCASDLVVCVADTAAGRSLFVVPVDDVGVLRRPLSSLDLTRRMAEVTFDEAPGRLVGSDGAADQVVNRVTALAALVLAGEATGGAARCLDTAVDYAKMRVQFGRSIGSFQAIKHLCAEGLVDVESARSALYRAMWALHERETSAGMLIHLAKALCCDTYMSAAIDNIQVHGGVGFTWEHDAHLHYRRAQVTRLLFDDPTSHRDRLMTHLLDEINGNRIA